MTYTKRTAVTLSRNLSYTDRAAFIRFARYATIGHWAEVIDYMGRELRAEGKGLDGKSIPPCAASMGCLCAGHARGNSANAPCDTREHA